jgi:fatty acid desaturase
MSKSIDPTQAKTRFVPKSLGRFLHDERDLPFIETTFLIAATIWPASAYFFAVDDFSWWLAVPYWIWVVFMLGPFLLMLHLICHRRFIKREHDWANKIVPWVIGPFFGQIPEGFYAHHVGMHHLENNLKDDLSSTLKFRRDSFVAWLGYFLKFVFIGRLELLSYFSKRKRMKLFKRLLSGMIFFYGLIFLAFFFNAKAAVVVFLVPTAIAWFGLMAGNWTQHAFIDFSDPSNPYKNSITVIDAVYNKRCFNDGYHIGHHLSPARHWTEMPGDFVANRQGYIDNKAVVFRALDYQVIWILLMTKSYRTLAKFFVNLDSEKPMSRDDIANFLRSRTQQLKA